MKKLVFFFVLVLGFFAWRSVSQNPVPQVLPATTIINQATLTIDFGSGQPVSAVLPLSGSPTAFSLLSTVTKLNSLPLETKPYDDFGTMVLSINGMANTSEKSWIYFVNGNSASVAADKYPVQSGDVIEWKYVKPQF